MKFCMDKLFLLSLIFDRVQVDGKYIIASADDVIKNSFIVVFYPDEARRSLRSIDPLTTFDSDANFSAQQVTNLASSIYDDVGGGFKVSNIYTKAILGFAASGDEKVMQKVAQNPNVMNVEENRVVRVSQQTPATWGIDRVDQRDRPLDNTYSPPRDGTGVAAYIIDTGVQISHDEFGDRARWGTNTSGDSDDSDCHGHGTHVAGTVGGSIYGVAKNVEIIAVKVLTCAGSGSNIGVIDGVEWVLNDAGLKGKPATANMSLGGGFSASLNAAVKALNNGGVPTVVAAGNDNGNACTYSPASEPDVITVGSTTSNDSRSGFSNFGSCVDIFAPGSGITAAWIGSNSATNTISGTSMASPHVCGGVALLLQEGIEPGDIAGEIVSRATKNKVTDPKAESPNELLFVGPIGPTNAPTPAPPTPAPTPCISKTVIVEVTTDNYPQETSWELTNLCSGDVQAESDPFPSPGETYTSEECIPSAEYTFKITDSYGDGLCCSYGQGSYTVTYDDVIEKEGAQFGSSESTTFGSCPSSPTSSAPVEPTSAPVEPTSAPVEPTSAPVEPTSAPVEPTLAPVEPTSAPVEPTSAPVEPTSAPVEPTLAPVEPTSAPVEPTLAPVELTSAPVEPTSAPVEVTDSPTACNECSNDSTPWMKNNEVECYTYEKLNKKCKNNGSWTNNNYCQLSCFENGVGYEGDNCCVSPPTNPPTNPPVSPTDCTECTNATTPWMRRNDINCDTFQSLNQKCKNNANWRNKKYCELSCYNSGNGYVGDICCTN